MRLRPEGAGDFSVFAHPWLLIHAACSMIVAQGTRPLQCVAAQGGTQKAVTVAWSRKTGVRDMAQG